MASVAEILLAQGQRSADARRRMAEITAGTWRDVGTIAAQTISGIGQQYAQHQADAPRREAEALQLKGLRDAAAAHEATSARESTFKSALQQPHRAKVLESLQGDPELYRRASEHYTRIDENMNRLMGEAAAGVREFNDSPDAAIAAIDDLIAQGFDERRMEQYRAAIQQDPANVSMLIDGLLKNSPDERHRSLVKAPPKPAEPFTLSPGQQRFGADGKPIASVAPTPEAEKTFTVTVKGPGGRPVKKVFTESELRAGVEEYREPKDMAQPSRFWVMRNGQPVRITEAEYRAGDAPANSREQGRPVVSGDAGRIADFDTSLDDLDVLSKTLSGIKGGTGVAARAGASLPNFVTEATGWGESAKQRQAVIDRVKQVIGKTLEGGVLRKEDEAKYTKILPTIGDTAAVATEKIKGLQTAISLRRDRQIDALEDAGYDVSGFRSRKRTTGTVDPLGIRK